MADVQGENGRDQLGTDPHEGDHTWRKAVLVTVGVVVALLGAIFTLQGLGVIGGSAMTGSTLWAILGPIIAVAGIALVVFGLRRGRKP